MKEQKQQKLRHERVLVIDDDPDVAEIVRMILHQSAYQVVLASTAKSGIEKFHTGSFDLVVTDLKLPDMSGLEVIRQVKDLDESIPIIMMTSFSSIESAVLALRSGAVDYIIKPFNNDEFSFAVKRAIQERHMRRENIILKRNLKKAYTSNQIIGESSSIKQVLDLIAKVSASDANVLIHGESGTGKELVAQAIHYGGTRGEGPFVPINCGAIPADLLESELFGHVKGAYSGATSTTEGLIREADGGTLFLDEVSDLALNLQVKLLRVLQEKQVRPLGSTQNYATDARFLAASNRDLKNEMAQGRFRADLFYRLNVIDIYVPPLRERGNDVEILAQHFIKLYSRRLNKKIKSISPDLKRYFHDYSWPGNIRELENFIERSVILADTDLLTVKPGSEILPIQRKPFSEESMDNVLTVEDYMKEFILRYQDNYKETELAAMLGIGRKALWLRRNRWGLFRSGLRDKSDGAAVTGTRH